ncbi:helix-turn-helix domain-containing protein [Kribbella sp. CCNWLW201]|uniref:helix-turn-helix domain-containing protein n=1 Tax=Kribbella sp. CCNWLW201 TaxID=3127475 RepID=UPI003076F259
MYDEETRAVAVAAMVAGESLNAISLRLGVSRATLRDWRDRPVRAERPTACPRCSIGHLPAGPYAHLLGFNSDGCRVANPRRNARWKRSTASSARSPSRVRTTRSGARWFGLGLPGR